MADEPLKRLLDAEAQAERVLARADEERKQILDQAKQEIQSAEQRHAARVQEIRAAFLAQAEQRAQQTIAEMRRRHTEQTALLRASAASMEQRALDAAIALLTGAESGGS